MGVPTEGRRGTSRTRSLSRWSLAVGTVGTMGSVGTYSASNASDALAEAALARPAASALGRQRTPRRMPS